MALKLLNLLSLFTSMYVWTENFNAKRRSLKVSSPGDSEKKYCIPNVLELKKTFIRNPKNDVETNFVASY